MSNPRQKLSFREKAGYSLGDASANLVFQTMIIFQMGFYTDVFGITPWLAGFLLVGVRLLDACFDPIVGTLADRTKTRWGKFRPWVLFSAPFFGVIFWLTFTTPDLGPQGKAIYAVVVYILLMMVYSINNVPYSALTGVMTSDAEDRTKLSSYRFVAAMAATFVVQGLTLPLVAKFGGTDVQKGWSITFGIFAVIAVVFFVITFFSVKERIQPDPAQKANFKDNLRAINLKPWYAMFVLTLFIFITLALRGGGLYYYFSYFVDKQALHDFLGGFGLQMPGGDLNWWQATLNAFGLLVKDDLSNATGVGLGFNNMVGNIVTIIGVMCSPWLVGRFGKKAVFFVGLLATTIATAAIYFVSPTQMGLLFILGIGWSACYGPTIPVLWAMIADVADFSEWKNHYRATGFVFAGVVFALKAGLGFGGAIGGWILGAYGYVANAEQSASALLGIQLSASIYPAICFGISVLALCFYPITRDNIITMQAELEERRKGFEQAE
ncbi:MAG: MFS transporter [Opitutales bacterium]|jgi:Na+/melibiose symporter-like transporter